MRTGELLAIAAGAASLGFAFIQGQAGRSYEPFLIAAVALFAIGVSGRQLRKLALGPSGLSFEQSDHQPPAPSATRAVRDLKLSIMHAYPVGGAEAMIDSQHIVEIKAFNDGDRPVAIRSLGLKFTGDKWAPFMHVSPYPDNVGVPGILQPQQFAAVYNDYKGLVDSIREEGIRITHIVAHLGDGTEHAVEAPENFKKLPGGA